MAQTRACSKTLANMLRWIATLAGYEGTPGEEIVDVANSTLRGVQGATDTMQESSVTERQLEYIEKCFKRENIDVVAFEQAAKPLNQLTKMEARKMLDLLFDRNKTATTAELLAILGISTVDSLAEGMHFEEQE